MCGFRVTLFELLQITQRLRDIVFNSMRAGCFRFIQRLDQAFKRGLGGCRVQTGGRLQVSGLHRIAQVGQRGVQNGLVDLRGQSQFLVLRVRTPRIERLLSFMQVCFNFSDQRLCSDQLFEPLNTGVSLMRVGFYFERNGILLRCINFIELGLDFIQGFFGVAHLSLDSAHCVRFCFASLFPCLVRDLGCGLYLSGRCFRGLLQGHHSLLRLFPASLDSTGHLLRIAFGDPHSLVGEFPGALVVTLGQLLLGLGHFFFILLVSILVRFNIRHGPLAQGADAVLVG